MNLHLPTKLIKKKLFKQPVFLFITFIRTHEWAINYSTVSRVIIDLTKMDENRYKSMKTDETFTESSRDLQHAIVHARKVQLNNSTFNKFRAVSFLLLNE